MSLAEKINNLPFYQACREADQLCDRSENMLYGTIWFFNDGSSLASFIKDNVTAVSSKGTN